MGSSPFSFQVQVFRTMHSPEGLLTFNFRPLQPLSDREVLFNVADNMRRGPWVHNSALSPIVTSFMLGIFLVPLLVVLQQWTEKQVSLLRKNNRFWETVKLKTLLRASEWKELKCSFLMSLIVTSVHQPVTGFVFPHIHPRMHFHNYCLGGTKFKALFIRLIKLKI
jgi:hypothetical protein